MQRFFKSGNARFWLWLGALTMMLMLWKAGEAINARLAALPIKTAPRTETSTPPLDQANFYAVWVKRITSKPATTEGDAGNMDSLFQKKPDPKAQLEALKPEEPDYVEIFKKSATIQGVSDSGVYVNGRFYRTGDQLEGLAMLDGNGKQVVPLLQSIKDDRVVFTIRKEKVVFSLGAGK